MQLTALVYGSYGVARLPSMALDGMPSSLIVGVTALELIVALVGLAILWKRRDVNTSAADQFLADAPAVP